MEKKPVLELPPPDQKEPVSIVIFRKEAKLSMTGNEEINDDASVPAGVRKKLKVRYVRLEPQF